MRAETVLTELAKVLYTHGGIEGPYLISCDKLYELCVSEIKFGYGTSGASNIAAMHTYWGEIRVSKQSPEPDQKMIERAVRDELNRREIYRQKHCRK